MSALISPPFQQRGPAAGTAPPPIKKSFDLVDLKQYLHIIVRRIWLVALCFVISVTVMVVMLVRQVPVYRCKATLLLSSGLPMPSSLRQTEIEPRGEYVGTQQLIIQSGLLNARARERMKRPGEDVASKIIGISVSSVGMTAFMSIQVTSLDPVLGAEMANALAEEYLAFKSEERMNTSQATVLNLTQQANRIHEELKNAEARALAYARENSVVAIQDLGNIAAQHLARLAAQAAEFKTERMFLEAQQPLLSQATDDTVLTAIMPPGAIPGLGMSSITALTVTTNATASSGQTSEELIEYGVVSQSGWGGLKRNQAMLEAQLAEYRKSFKDGHPLVQQTLRKLQENQRALDVELQFALRQFYAKLESLSIKEQAAKRVEQEWEEQALDVSRKAQEYRSIQRNFDRLQALYDLVFNRLKEIDISFGIEPESVQIMERARPATSPITPRKMQSIFVAALIGIGIGLGLVLGLEYIDDSLRYPEEVTQGLGLPFFGLVPAANWDPVDLRTHVLANIDQKSGLAEAYRNLRSSLLFSGAEDHVRTIVLTSAVPKEGKTTTCLNLGVSLSQAGSRVLMVDGDLRRGELHKYFGLEGGRGFSDILIGQAKPEAVIQRTGLPNLDLVATGFFPPNPAELILRPELNSFLDYAKRTYDRILIDCPPLMAVSEAGILASIAEGVILVVW
ncbi:MAG: polysaccharide biosynthesis tyrosine autokinase, partial [Pseudomonadota bacterium]